MHLYTSLLSSIEMQQCGRMDQYFLPMALVPDAFRYIFHFMFYKKLVALFLVPFGPHWQSYTEGPLKKDKSTPLTKFQTVCFLKALDAFLYLWQMLFLVYNEL